MDIYPYILTYANDITNAGRLNFLPIDQCRSAVCASYWSHIVSKCYLRVSKKQIMQIGDFSSGYGENFYSAKAFLQGPPPTPPSMHDSLEHSVVASKS